MTLAVTVAPYPLRPYGTRVAMPSRAVTRAATAFAHLTAKEHLAAVDAGEHDTDDERENYFRRQRAQAAVDWLGFFWRCK